MGFADNLFTRFAIFAGLAGLAIAGCSGSGGPSSSTSASGAAGSGVAATGGSSSGGATTQGIGTSTGAASSTGGSGTGGTVTGGSSTGATIPEADGGYVSCSMASAADAGPNGDGGPAFWLCRPGTYVCDTSGSIGNCFQCLSDEDCANPQLPTYDPDHPKCDLTSGIVGYQNFCQECVADSDCRANPAGSFCDLNPNYPPGATQPEIVDLGFEHCGMYLTDCRIDGGPGCSGVNQSCDSASGVCKTNPGTCSTDQDCVGLLNPSNAYLPEPYCVKGACSSCTGAVCPNVYCATDADCGNPDSLPTGLICSLTTYQCSCTDSSQCGGFWPECEIPAGTQPNDAGQILGSCGCDETSECGDAGLVCQPPNGSAATATWCGLPCTSPGFPACRAAAYLPICNPVTGSCTICTEDDQCQSGVQTGGPTCDYSVGGQGNCGCLHDQDCPTGQACQQGAFLGVCGAALSGCTADSCGGNFCDWDAGTCLSSVNASGLPACITDYDCGLLSTGFVCENGACLQCRSNADCVANGSAASSGSSACCLPGNTLCAAESLASHTCADVCMDNQDCTGNLYGPNCLTDDAGNPPHCGCGSDQDCAGYLYGHHCDTDPTYFSVGSCNCLSDSDCDPSSRCLMFGTGYGFCSAYCSGGDAGLTYPCGPNYFCDPGSTCRPRCDDGNTCQGNDQTCDTANQAGQNGQTIDGPVAGATWCYSCLQAGDCAAGQGCNPLHGCGSCSQSSDCPSGTVCIDGGICQPSCSNGACQTGEVCDVHGLVGYGPNVCFQCISSADCPDGEGCNDQSHTCGTCLGPNASGGPYDCPPDAICSSYWSPARAYTPGVCLAGCDHASCPADEPICAVYPGLTPEHKFCFGCLQDSDCPDAGPGTRCNLAPNPTFTCVTGS